jgi:CBS domain containing-hemolysin-like protein
MPLTLSLSLVPVLILLNAFFVAAEYAVVAAKPDQIESMRRRGRRAAAAAIEALQASPASAIGAIQICITMTNLMLGWIGEPAMSAVLYRLFGPLIRLSPGFMGAVSTALSFIVVTLLTVVFSELLPKALTLRYAEAAASLTAAVVLWIKKVVTPLVWLMNKLANALTRPLGLGSVEDMEARQVSVEELRLLAVQAGEEGVLRPRERSLVLNSLALGRRKAKEVMVPRTRVAYLDLSKSMDENRRVVDEHLYTRLPLCEGDLDHVIGVVHVKEFLAAHEAGGDVAVLRLIAAPAVFIPETLSLDRVLTTLHEHHTQVAFLVDEYGGVEGMLTLQDVVDELVGEIGRQERSGPAPNTLPPTL